MVQDGWGGFQKDLYEGEDQEGRLPSASLRYMGSGLHAETGCRKVYAGEVFEWQKNPRILQNMHQKIFKIWIKISSKYLSIYLHQSIVRITPKIDGLTDETHGHINSAGCKGMATIRKIHSLHSSFLISQTTIVVFKINNSYICFQNYYLTILKLL